MPHRFAGWIRATLLATLGLLGACSDNPSLEVFVRTDLVPGVEFTRVEVVVEEDVPAGVAATQVAARGVDITHAMSFYPERSVANLDLASGSLVVRVKLIDANGNVAAQRPVRLAFATDFALVVTVTRNCSGVSCEEGQACFDGLCVDSRCQPSATDYCSEPKCTATDLSMCSSPSSCAVASCVEGVCLYTSPESSSCGSNEYCDPFVGCEPLPSVAQDMGIDADMSLPDAGPLPPPRLIRPMHANVVTSRQPEFRWEMPVGVGQATLQICEDAACASVVHATTTAGAVYTPATPLDPGTYFWRMHAGAETDTTQSPSATRVFYVGAHSGSNDGTYGNGRRDVNGDGYDDVIVGSRYAAAVSVYLGGRGVSGISAPPSFTMQPAGLLDEEYGRELTVTDVNGDGFADIFAGAIYFEGNVGRVYGHMGTSEGPPLTPDVTIENPRSEDALFASGLAAAGDVNGDGFGDLVVSGFDSVHVFHGGAIGLAATPARSLAAIAYETQSHPVVAGDFNGDGYSDLAISGATPRRIAIFHGSASGIGSAESETIGYECILASPGDVNGDGYDDLACIADGVRILRGSADGILMAPLSTSPLPTMVTGSDEFGQGASGVGDLNADGFADLLVAAKSFGADDGRAFAYMGSATGLRETPEFTIYGSESEMWGYGTDVGPAGDMNGDGCTDIVVGTEVGRAFVYRGDPSVLGLGSAPVASLSTPSGVTAMTWGASVANQ